MSNMSKLFSIQADDNILVVEQVLGTGKFHKPEVAS